MTRIAIVGAGAVGCAIGARLHRAGIHEVAFVTRTPLHRIVVEASGERIEFAPRFAKAQSGRSYSFVLLATKAHETTGAADWLRALAGPRSTIAILQNGVEHAARVAPLVEGVALVPVVVECPATRTSPGHVVQRSPARLTVPDSPEGHEFASLFDRTGIVVSTTRDFTEAAWRKLCENVAGGVLTAWTRRPLGVIGRPSLTRLARALVDECVVVARAEGVELGNAVVDEVVAKLLSGPPDAPTSMLADRLAGRRLELDARNGAVVRIGARHGIDAAFNRRIVERLLAGRRRGRVVGAADCSADGDGLRGHGSDRTAEHPAGIRDARSGSANHGVDRETPRERS